MLGRRRINDLEERMALLQAENKFLVQEIDRMTGLCSEITRQLQAINEKIDVLDSNEHKQVDTDSVIINEDGMYDTRNTRNMHRREETAVNSHGSY